MAARALYTNTIILLLSRVRSYRFANPPRPGSLPSHPSISLFHFHSLFLALVTACFSFHRFAIFFSFLVDLTLQEPAHFRTYIPNAVSGHFNPSSIMFILRPAVDFLVQIRLDRDYSEKLFLRDVPKLLRIYIIFYIITLQSNQRPFSKKHALCYLSFAYEVFR